MSPHAANINLWEIVVACEAVQRFSAGISSEEHAQSELVQSEVERQFTIIVETLNPALAYDPSIRDLVRDVHKIIATRHRLAHDHRSTSPAIIWSAVTNHLPGLQLDLQSVLKE
jgi:uncharacterized protein with HEPN domain